MATCLDAGWIDSHFHVIASPERHPMLPTRSYTPAPASVRQWHETLSPFGIRRGVVVQPSFYGTDNRMLLAALAEGDEHLVGVAAVAADVPDDELDRLAAAGVRGVRMAHFNAGDPRAMGGFVPFSAFDALEGRLQQRHMHLQLFTDSRLLPGIGDRIVRSRVPVVIDHMGRAPASLGDRHVGIKALIRLMVDGPVFVKLSGIANISDASPGYADARAVHEALLAARPERLLWGSDWPHTKPSGARPSTASLVRLFQAWTPPGLQDLIARDNASALYRCSGE
ncbi:amidohydrolase family protein [Ideonella margarita]|uniref:Amidohydrolase family protein n=1 Tax=Ideonella margarita TaxID=2984191 RepID=A0ABU9C339_9BURK